MSEVETFDLGCLAHGQNAVLHVLDGAGEHSWERVAACGATGTVENIEEGVDARAVRVKGRSVCGNCRTVIENRRSTERRPTTSDAAASSADGLSGTVPATERRESSMAAQTGDRKKSSTSRRRAPSRVRSAAAPAAEKTEKGTSILDGLYKALSREVGEFEKSPNKSQTYTRLRINGKAFAYIFPPRPGSVAVKIPKQLLDVASKLPKDHGFKRTDWGLTLTLSAAADAPKVAKALAVAAAAVKPKEEAAEAKA